MARMPRRYLTIEQTEDFWARWSRGESLKAIGRAFDKTSSAIYLVLSRTGGVRPTERKRHPKSLTLYEREEISRGLAQGLSILAIAEIIERAASTISREVRRNGGRTWPGAGAALAAAADRWNFLFVPGSMTSVSVETVRNLGSKLDWFQMYPSTNLDFLNRNLT